MAKTQGKTAAGKPVATPAPRRAPRPAADPGPAAQPAKEAVKGSTFTARARNARERKKAYKESIAEQYPDTPLKVRATAPGYYEHERKRVGDVFTIPNGRMFSANWMELAPATARKSTTTTSAALGREHKRIREEAVDEKKGEGLDGPDPLGAGDDE